MVEQTATATLFVSAAFKAWRCEHVEFLVLRNYEYLPEFTTNDIDVLVRPEQRNLAEKVLLKVASTSGFRLHNRAEFATLALYFSTTGGTVQVHFDLFTKLAWRGFNFLDCRNFLDHRIECGSFYIPRPAEEAATNLLSYAVYRGRIKEKYKDSIVAGFSAEPWAAERLLAISYGTKLARFLVEASLQRRWEAIERRLNALRRRLIFRSLNRHPISTLFSLGREALRGLRRIVKPAGCVVVLCGPDGCGKSTAAEKVMEILAPTFSPAKSAYYHWKPRIFAGASRASRNNDAAPHGKPVRSRLLSIVYFGFHWIEFLLGSWWRLSRMSFRGGLVVVDRFYYDFFVDQRRYRLDVPRALISIGYLPLKKPDLVFLLDAPAEVLQSRKQEVSADETARQREAYVELASRLPYGIAINAVQPADRVARDIAVSILEHMATR